MSKTRYYKAIASDVTRYLVVRDGKSLSLSLDSTDDSPWLDNWPIDLSKDEKAIEIPEEEIVAAFQSAWPKFIDHFPSNLRPAGLVPALCPCGCGEPVKPGRMYANPKLCKVRNCRKKPKGVLPVVTDVFRQMAGVGDEFRVRVIDLPWFVLEYHRKTFWSMWLITKTVEGGKASATKSGFKHLSSHKYVTAAEMFEQCLLQLECIKEIDYLDVEFDKIYWNVLQHFAFSPNRQLLADDPAVLECQARANAMLNKVAPKLPMATGIQAIAEKAKKPKLTAREKEFEEARLNAAVLKAIQDSPIIAPVEIAPLVTIAETKAAKICSALFYQGEIDGSRHKGVWRYWPKGWMEETAKEPIAAVTPKPLIGLRAPKPMAEAVNAVIAKESAYKPLAVPSGPKPPIVPPAPKPAQEFKEKDMVALLAKRILRAIKEGCEDDREKLYAYCNRWGMWPGYGRDLDLAMKQLVKKGKLKPIKTLSLTHRVIQFLGDNEFTPMEIAVGLAIEKDKFNSIRSTINILLLKGELGRRIVPGKDGYSYARSAYCKENGIAYLNK